MLKCCINWQCSLHYATTIAISQEICLSNKTSQFYSQLSSKLLTIIADEVCLLVGSTAVLFLRYSWWGFVFWLWSVIFFSCTYKNTTIRNKYNKRKRPLQTSVGLDFCSSEWTHFCPKKTTKTKKQSYETRDNTLNL